MVLLTSGQVSMAISSFVVFLFTSALFLSGYVLQQQTVRDLRAAIKPRPIPEAARMYLPKKFALPEASPKADASELAGLLDEVVEVKELTSNISADNELELGSGGLDDVTQGQSSESGEMGDQKRLGITEQRGGTSDGGGAMIEKLEEEKTLSRAARRKKIKEEILAAGEGEGFKGYKRRQW